VLAQESDCLRRPVRTGLVLGWAGKVLDSEREVMGRRFDATGRRARYRSPRLRRLLLRARGLVRQEPAKLLSLRAARG